MVDINTTNIHNGTCRTKYSSTNFHRIEILKEVRYKTQPTYHHLEAFQLSIPIGGSEWSEYKSMLKFYSHPLNDIKSNFKYIDNSPQILYFDRKQLFEFLEDKYPKFNKYMYDFSATYYEVRQGRSHLPLYMIGKFDGKKCTFLLGSNDLNSLIENFR